MELRRSIFIGGMRLALPLFRRLVEVDSSLVSVFSPSPKAARQSSDYVSLKDYGDGLPFHEYEKINSPETLEQIRSYQPDILYVFGVSELLKEALLSIPSIGCLGGHIADLPRNRGRHPIVWSIANGLTESAVSVIWLSSGADTGDLAAQQRFEIHPHEHAGDIYEKVQQIYVDLVAENLIKNFQSGVFPREKQPAGPSNIWRKRKHADGVIDWRMSAHRIHNLVRALHPPYPCASFYHKGNEYMVTETRVEHAPENLEPGKILEVAGARILVKAGEDAVWLEEHTFDASLVVPDGYMDV